MDKIKIKNLQLYGYHGVSKEEQSLGQNFEIDVETGRQVGRETLLVQWQQGRKMVVWPPDQACSTLVYPWR